jgi:hypothetical protein
MPDHKSMSVKPVQVHWVSNTWMNVVCNTPQTLHVPVPVHALAQPCMPCSAPVPVPVPAAHPAGSH